MRGVLAAWLVVGLLAGWCVSPSASAAPPVTPVPASAQDADVVLTAWRAHPPAWQEDFASPTPLWPTGDEDGSSRYVAQGAYHIAVAERRALSFGITPRPASAFLFEASVTKTAGPLDSEYGLLFGCQEGQDCYFFAVSSDGYFLLDVWQEGKRMSLIEPAATAPAALHTGLGATNRLGVSVQDNVITLYANDVALANRYDAQWQPGYIGVGVATNRQGGAEVLFDDVQLWPAPGEPQEAEQSGVDDLLANLPTVPTATPAPAAQKTPTPATTPASAAGSLAAALEALRASPPAWQETFEVDDGHWFTARPEQGSCNYQDGALALSVHGNALGSLCGHFDENLTLPANYLLEVTATTTDQSLITATICLMFGRHGSQGYEFCINSATYSLNYLAEDGSVTSPVELVPSSLVHVEQGAANRLGILVEGTTVTLLINGQPVRSYQDDDAHWQGGSFGLVAGTSDMHGTTVLFDNLRLWAVTSPLNVDGSGVPPTPTPTPVVAPQLDDLPIFWDTLKDRFLISNIRIVEEVEPGHKIPDYFVTFDFELIADTNPFYSVEFLDQEDMVKRVNSVELLADPDTPASLFSFLGGWYAGVHGKGKFALPREYAKYAAIVITETFQYE